MQAIRIDQVDHDASLGTTVTFFDDDNQRWAITGDVIELTEEQMGNAMPPSSRWVSDWVVADGY